MISRDDNLSQKMRNLIIKHEGKKKKPYVDTVGKVTIGVGRNLTDVGLTDDEMALMLDNDIERIRHELHARLPWIYDLEVVRQWVVINMAFMGVGKLLGFVNMLSYLEKKDYVNAAKEMLRSKWRDEVGDRALDLARIMQFGVLV